MIFSENRFPLFRIMLYANRSFALARAFAASASRFFAGLAVSSASRRRRAAFNIASYTLLPFGRKAVSRAEHQGTHDIGTGPFGLLGNIVWLVLAGWWLALGHLLTAILLAVTIIGIPFAWAHFKLAGIALWPIGKMIVDA